MDKLKAAVIGVGAMGRHHARVYAEMEETALVAVADLDAERADAVADEWGARAYAGYAEMLERERPDAVSVAVPTQWHRNATITCLQAGCHVLVEKPIARYAVHAEAMVEIAERNGLVLAVGHIERCNPIVTAVKGWLDAGRLGRVYRISTRRVGPNPERARDVGVVVDLATHDLDIMRYLLRSEMTECRAMLQRARGGEHEDSVDALLKFDCGAVGVLEADWLTPAKERTLAVTGEKGTIAMDYIRQTGIARLSPTKVHYLDVPPIEPLLLELRAFAAAARGEGRPAATGLDGLRALEMAQTILESAE